MTLEHPGASPFELGERGRPCVELFHGLTGAPSELWPLGLGLAAAGYRVQAPLWRGHGTTPAELAATSAEDLIGEARRATSDPAIDVIGGLSMGALLALLATEGRPNTRALILMAPALQLEGRNRLFASLTRWTPLGRLSGTIPKGAPDPGYRATPMVEAPQHSREEISAARAAEGALAMPGADGRYSRIPLRWGRELGHLGRLAARAAPNVKCPVLILHGLEDRTASPESALRLAERLGGEVQIRFFASSPHLLALGPERGAVAAEVVRFLRRIVPVAETGWIPHGSATSPAPQ
jgi:carboxylesterase